MKFKIVWSKGSAVYTVTLHTAQWTDEWFWSIHVCVPTERSPIKTENISSPKILWGPIPRPVSFPDNQQYDLCCRHFFLSPLYPRAKYLSDCSCKVFWLKKFLKACEHHIHVRDYPIWRWMVWKTTIQRSFLLVPGFCFCFCFFLCTFINIFSRAHIIWNDFMMLFWEEVLIS